MIVFQTERTANFEWILTFFFFKWCPQGNNNSSLLMAPMVDRIHVSASNPNLLTHCNSDAGKPDSPLSIPHENRIQEIRLRENFVATAENGEQRQLMHLMHTLCEVKFCL